MDPLPPVNHAYHILQQVEKQKSLALSFLMFKFQFLALYILREVISNQVLDIFKIFLERIIRNIRIIYFVITVRREDI